ncbi:N-6 DNA methylase [Niabella hibiscisoli]|uniref:N-6 DNA methylase n=1 Tax=Niabella hibiscisoli TaxID=1825928 RepID=UPI001F0FF59A|nr:N-6 DNA methylase [Niabella hibiscisoli]MCH5716681.1 N-6 DNA methylase [Niabella hibiscisoli]
MSKSIAAYNERSWAIDLIGHVKTIVSQNNRSIKDAGGEQTIRTDGGALFPDVLLFGDRETARILQGWELKMPDTRIDDFEFRSNAETKARALGLDSFLLWNVSNAILYVRNTEGNYVVQRTWNDLADITTRTAVSTYRRRWETLAADIISYLNDQFDRGDLEGRQFIEAYRSGGITGLIMENAGETSEAIRRAAVRDAGFRNELTVWWDRYSAEYGKGTKEQVLAQAVISNWIGKFLFAHILRERDMRAQTISSINDETTPSQALALFSQLSDACNFWTIFSDSLGLSFIPAKAWDHLKQFNHLLSDLRIGSVDQAQLSGILEATVEVATRKLRGQYPTPIELARLLVNICMRDLESDRILDPCCGSGTIARAALENKLAAGVNPEQASATVYASDQDPQAVQIATFALANPSLMHMPIRIFKQDAFSLTPTTNIDFRNPSTGTVFSERLGTFQAITSNLPFVAQAGRSQFGNALDNVYSTMLAGRSFTGRADVAAYLPFSLYPLLGGGGRLGIIITNSWLGTDWGDDFYTELATYYDLKCVITSGAGRWFRNSDVITNILIMDKKDDPAQPSGDIKFVVLTCPLEEMEDEEIVRLAAAQIELGDTASDTMTIRTVSQTNMTSFRTLGLGGNAQFVNCDWVLQLPLISLNTVFEIRRGERRGMNEFFIRKLVTISKQNIYDRWLKVLQNLEP